MSDYRKLSRADFEAEARGLFGADVMGWAFCCPNCGDIATPQDFADAGADPNLTGQECIGRHLGALKQPAGKRGKNRAGRGCDWVAYGLIRGPWEVVVSSPDEPERSIWSFPLAAANGKAE